MKGGKPTGTTSLQSSHVHCKHSPRTVWTLLDFTAGPLCHTLYWKMEPTNIFFRYSSKPELVFSGVESRNSKTVCTGFIIWCLLSGVIKTWNGEKMAVKERAHHRQLTAVVHISCPASQAVLPMPRALATGKPLEPAGLGGHRAHTDCMASLPDPPGQKQPFQLLSLS